MFVNNRWLILAIVTSTLFLIIIDMTVLYTASDAGAGCHGIGKIMDSERLSAGGRRSVTGRGNAQ